NEEDVGFFQTLRGELLPIPDYQIAFPSQKLHQRFEIHIVVRLIDEHLVTTGHGCGRPINSPGRPRLLWRHVLLGTTTHDNQEPDESSRELQVTHVVVSLGILGYAIITEAYSQLKGHLPPRAARTPTEITMNSAVSRREGRVSRDPCSNGTS
ncbi:MAG: hypothetical protein V3T24_06390, partial [Longimicrobiales bacterium]